MLIGLKKKASESCTSGIQKNVDSLSLSKIIQDKVFIQVIHGSGRGVLTGCC